MIQNFTGNLPRPVCKGLSYLESSKKNFKWSNSRWFLLTHIMNYEIASVHFMISRHRQILILCNLISKLRWNWIGLIWCHELEPKVDCLSLLISCRYYLTLFLCLWRSKYNEHSNKTQTSISLWNLTPSSSPLQSVSAVAAPSLINCVPSLSPGFWLVSRVVITPSDWSSAPEERETGGPAIMVSCSRD